MKYLFAITMGLFSFFGCKGKDIKSDIYAYNTEAFENKIKEFTLSIDSAATKAAEYYFDNLNKSEKDYSSTLHIIYNDYYIFTTVPHNPKLLEYNMTGIWVNGKTGEVKYVETEDWTKVNLGHYPKNTYIKRIENKND